MRSFENVTSGHVGPKSERIKHKTRGGIIVMSSQGLMRQPAELNRPDNNSLHNLLVVWSSIAITSNIVNRASGQLGSKSHQSKPKNEGGEML